MANQNPPSGTDVESLKLGVDTSEFKEGEKDLDSFGASTVKVVKNVDDLTTSTEKNDAATAKNNKTKKESVIQTENERAALAELAKIKKQLKDIDDAAADAGQLYLIKLQEMVATLNMTTAELQRYKAAQLNVLPGAEEFITALERQSKAMTQVEYSAFRTMEAQEALYLKTTSAAEYAALKEMEANEAVYLKKMELRRADEAALAAHVEKEIAATKSASEAAEYAALKQMEANEQLFLKREAEEQAIIKLAEQRAIEEIRWATMSTKAQIAELERLKAYKESNAIRPETIDGSFSSAAINNLGNLDELVAKQAALEASSHRVARATDEVSSAFRNNRVRTEGLVLAHEALQGRWTRLGGSLMVLLEYMNTSITKLLGVSTGVLALVGALGLLVFEMYKGETQTKAFNDALIKTNGYSGETVDHLETLAHSVGNLTGEYNDAYKAAAQLTASGKFTRDQIDEITKAAAEMSHAFGQDVNVTIKEFETLVKRSTVTGAAQTLEVTKAVAKLDEQYHFLTVSQVEHIVQLEKEGKQIEASAFAIDLFTKHEDDAAKKSVENTGWIMRSWHAVSTTIRGVFQMMQDIGKESTQAEKMQYWAQQIPKNQDGSLNLDTTKTHDYSRLLAISEYTKAREALSKIESEAAAQAIVEQRNAAAKHELEVRAIEDVRLMKKTLSEKDAALAKFDEGNKVIELAQPGYMEKNKEYLDERREAIIKAHTEKVAAIKNDGRKQDLAGQLSHETEVYNLVKESSESQIRLLQDQFKKGSLSQEDAYKQEKAARDAQLVALENEEKQKLAILNKYHPLNNVDAERVKAQSQAIVDAYTLAKTKIEAAQTLADQKNGEEELNKYVKAIDKAGDVELKRLDKLIEKQKEKNGEIGKTKEQVDQFKKSMDDEATDELQKQADAIDLLLTKNEIIVDGQTTQAIVGKEAQAIYAADLDKLHQIIKARKELAATYADGADLEAAHALQKQVDQDWKRTNKKIGDDLATAIVDGGGKGFRKLIRDMEIAFAKAVLQPILAPISAGITNLLYPNATQAGGAAGAAGAGGIGGAIGLVNAAQNAYKAVSGGFQAIGTSVSGGVDSVLGQFGPGAIGSTGASGTASMLGGAASSVGGYMAGSALNSAISGQYQTGSGIQTAEKIATAVASYINPVAGAVVGAISGLINRAFGRGPTQARAQGMRGTVSDSGVTGSTFQDFHQDGGWFRSDKNWTDTKALDSSVVNSFASGLGSMKAISTDFAKSLGLSGDALKNYSKTFDITLTNDAAANQKAITDFFNVIGDDMAKKLVPNIASFAQSGENASQTLERLSNVFKATDQIAALLGKDASSMFGAVGLASDKARERLVNLAGGLDKLTALTSTYAQNYLTDAEKIAPLQKAVADAMKQMGFAGITTKSQFKELVNALDLSTETGAKAYVNLMQVQDAFSQVADYSGKAADAILNERKSLQDQLDQLILSQSQLLAKERAALDPANRGLFDQLQAAKSLKDAQDTQKNSLTELISKMKTFSSSMVSLRDSLLVGGMSTLTNEQQYVELRKQYELTKTAAKGGDATAQGNLTSIANAFLTASQKINGGDSKYAEDFQNVLQASDALSKWASTQVDKTQASLDALNKQVISLDDINSTLHSMATSLVNLPSALSAQPPSQQTPAPAPADPVLTKILDNLRAELAGLRKDQQDQTAQLLDNNNAANAHAANTVVAGVHAAHGNSNWKNNSRAELD